MALKTVEWKDNSVIMIDQTKLPNILEYVTYTDFNQVADAIRTLVVRGAPAIGVSKEDNFNKISDTKFKEFERTKQIKLSPDFLSELKIPILIIGGTNDDVVDLKESEEKIKILDNAELFVVDGADHSYKIPEHKRIVVERTVEFFKNSL